MTCIEIATDLICKAEGFISHFYLDNGHRAIGYGDDLYDATPADLARWQADGITEPEARHNVEVKVIRLEKYAANTTIPWAEMDEVRKAIVLDMMYQLGPGVLNWHDFRLALTLKNYGMAAAAMLDSKWARSQTPLRAQAEAAIMASGKLA